MASTSTLPIYIADAFTSKPFYGNSAAVCFLPQWSNDKSLQEVAKEMNLSETAFLVKDTSSKNAFHLRWFTPTIEVPLCGHATLASAHILFREEHGRLDEGLNTESITFHTKSGDLIVRQSNGKLIMDFPQGKPVRVELSSGVSSQLISALYGAPETPTSNIVDTWFCSTTRKLVVELESTKEIAALKPNFGSLTSISFSPYDVRGVIATTNTTKDSINNYDFVSRYFAPWSGIPEDPVTGSAHTVLAVYWSAKLDSRTHFSAYQASSRGGELSIDLTPEGRVHLGGDAVTVLKGTISALI